MKREPHLRYLVHLTWLTLLSMMSFAASGQTIIWQEDFALADGTMNDPMPPSIWTVDVSQTILDAGDYFEVRSQQNEGRDLDGEAVWFSEAIDISAHSDVFITLDVSEAGRLEATDYLRAYYSLDGGESVLFAEVTNDIQGGGPITLSALKLNGSSLEIKVCMMTNGGSEIFRFDNVIVGAPAPVYSISDGSWEDDTKWSYSENGPACNCMPSLVLPATITAGTTIEFNSNFDLQDLTIRAGGTARWTTSGRVTVKDNASITIENGGMLDNNGFDPDIYFEGNANVNIDDVVTGLTADEIRVYGDVNFTGQGGLNARLLRVFGNGNQVINDLVQGISINTNLQFNGSSVGSQFVNNAELSIGGDIRLNGSSGTITNNSSIILSDDVLVVNNSDINNSFVNNGTITFNQLRMGNAQGFYLENNGTMTLSDDFLAAPSDNLIVNAEGGILNYGGNGPDADVVLRADAQNNTVIYTRTSGASIITPLSGYRNLQIAGTNTKTAQGDLDILGNLIIDATFNANGYDIDLKGDLISNGTMINDGNTFNLSGTNQQITPGAGAFNDLILTGTGIKLFQDDIFVNGHFTNASTIDFAGAGQTIALGGNWINNGVLNNNDEIVLFDGSSDQLVQGNTSFSNLNLNKSAGRVLVEASIELMGELSIQSDTEFDADGAGNDQVFTLLSSATNDSRIGVLPSGASISGNLTAQRFLPAYGSKRWRNISSTVLNATVSDLQNEIAISGNFTGSDNGQNGIPANAKASLAYYDNTVGDATNTLDDRWVDYPTTSSAAEITDLSTSGRGFILWIRETDDVTFDLRGPVNQGPIDFAPTGAFERWNLLGNPYPSAIDWDGPGWVKSGIQGNAIHIWDGLNYRTWNGVIGSLGSGIIAKGQSFWIQGNQDSMTLQATEAVKASAPSAFLRTEKETYPYLELTVTNGEWQDVTYLALVEGAESGFDPMDANKLKNSVFNLSTASTEGIPLSINALDALECGDEIPVFLRDAWVGSYEMTWNNLESFPGLTSIKLRDHFTSTMYDLSQLQRIPFDVTSDSLSFGDSRFELLIGSTGISPELELLAGQNCDTQAPEITIKNSQEGVHYEILNGDNVVAQEVGTGNDLLVSFDQSEVNPGSNLLTVRGRIQSCETQSISETIELDYTPPPEIIYYPSQNILAIEAEGSIQWYLDGYPIENATSPSLSSEDLSGEIYVIVTTAQCALKSGSFLITASEDLASEGIEIYPNPFDTHFFVEENEPKGINRIDVISTNGSTLYSESVKDGRSRIQPTLLRPGIYIIRLYTEDKSYVIKLLKK